MKDLIYLASPYSTPRVLGNFLEERYQAALKAQQWLIDQGYCAWSPIVQTHHITMGKVLFHFWVDYNEAFIARCQQFFVLMLPGWQESNGTKDDLRLATLHNKPITYVEPLPDGTYAIHRRPADDRPGSPDGTPVLQGQPPRSPDRGLGTGTS